MDAAVPGALADDDVRTVTRHGEVQRRGAGGHVEPSTDDHDQLVEPGTATQRRHSPGEQGPTAKLAER